MMIELMILELIIRLDALAAYALGAMFMQRVSVRDRDMQRVVSYRETQCTE